MCRAVMTASLPTVVGLPRFREIRVYVDLLQHVVPAVRRILEMLRKARLLKMHDVLAAAGSGSNEHHASKDRWAVLHHLKRDHSSERVPEDIAPLDAESVKKRHGVSGHFGDSVRNFACRTPQASVVEED